jgi:hypothetical protein
MNPYDLLPARFREELKAYIEEGKRPGQFITAVLDNDLKGAYELIDPAGRLGHAELWREMTALMHWLREVAPLGCAGGPTRVEMWIKKGGRSGIPTQDRPWTGWPTQPDPAVLRKMYPKSFPEGIDKDAQAQRIEVMARVASNQPLDISLDQVADESNVTAINSYVAIVRGEAV